MKEWFTDPTSGECYRVKLKLEVLPDEQALAERAEAYHRDMLDDPLAPLAVKVWTAQDSYRAGDQVKVFLKGNRPFHGKVVYQDAAGKLTQLLPNPYRKDDYFNGGTVYALPSANDLFGLQVCPPFGAEEITVYASTSPLGELDVTPNGGVYTVRTRAIDVPLGTRGITFTSKEEKSGAPDIAEFAESSWCLTTRQE
jgi:hypothetical protein